MIDSNLLLQRSDNQQTNKGITSPSWPRKTTANPILSPSHTKLTDQTVDFAFNDRPTDKRPTRPINVNSLIISGNGINHQEKIMVSVPRGSDIVDVESKTRIKQAKHDFQETTSLRPCTCAHCNGLVMRLSNFFSYLIIVLNYFILFSFSYGGLFSGEERSINVENAV